MDLFNNKKLTDREAKIERLGKALSELKEESTGLSSQIATLEEEKEKQAELHRNVVDTMLAEIQEFISANISKNLSYLSFKTLFPLVEEVLENHSFSFKIEISHYYYSIWPSSKHKDLIIAHCDYIVDELKNLQMIEHASINNYGDENSITLAQPSVTFQINTRYNKDDFSKKLLSLQTAHFEYKREMKSITFREMSVTKDENGVVLSLKNNTTYRRNMGF